MLNKLVLTSLLLCSPLWASKAEPLDKVVAVINKDVITESELTDQVVALKKQLQAKGVEIPADKVLRKQILQHLIDVGLQLQLAKSNDITVEDAEIDAAIENIAKTNHIELTQLKEAINAEGLSWETYRNNIRKEMIVARIQQTAVGKDVTVSESQIDDYIKSSEYDKKRQATYHLFNIVVPLNDAPTSDEVEKAKQKANQLLNKIKQGADFSSLAVAESSDAFALEGGDLGERHLAELPELFAQYAIKMQVGEVLGPIRAANGYQLIKLVSVGGENKNHKVTKTHVRHILIKPESTIISDNAERQINNIYQQIKAGKDFSAMAKVYSVDAASAIQGGDLGWVIEEELVPEFAKAMTKLPLNTLSKPVKSPFGWHLIEVLERKTVDDSKGYERQQVRRFLTQRKFTEVTQNWVQHLRSDAYVKILDKELA